MRAVPYVAGTHTGFQDQVFRQDKDVNSDIVPGLSVIIFSLALGLPGFVVVTQVLFRMLVMVGAGPGGGGAAAVLLQQVRFCCRCCLFCPRRNGQGLWWIRYRFWDISRGRRHRCRRRRRRPGTTALRSTPGRQRLSSVAPTTHPIHTKKHHNHNGSHGKSKYLPKSSRSSRTRNRSTRTVRCSLP